MKNEIDKEKLIEWIDSNTYPIGPFRLPMVNADDLKEFINEYEGQEK